MSSPYYDIRSNLSLYCALVFFLVTVLSILYLLFYFPAFILIDRILGGSGILCLCMVIANYISEKIDSSRNLEPVQKPQTLISQAVNGHRKTRAEEDGLLIAASEFNRRGDYHAAIAACNEALKSDDAKDQAYLIRGIALHGLGLHISAVNDLTIATGLFPMNPYIYLWRAKAYQGCNLPREAIDDCNLVLNLSPDNAFAYKVRGEAHASMGSFHQALFDCQRFMSKCPACSFKHKASVPENSKNDIIDVLAATA